MTPERIAELREKIRDGRIIILTQGNIADVSDLLLLLDECEKTRAGAGPRIFPGVGQNPTLGGPSPGSSDDERALEYLYRWKRVFTSLGNGWTVEDENALAHIKSRLAAGSPKVTRGFVELHAMAVYRAIDQHDAKVLMGHAFREAGVEVEEEKP